MDPIKYEMEQVTPARADYFLAMNTNNRNVRRPTVEQYARAMKAGKWGLSPQPISVNGQTLLDGQHRLHAVKLSGCTVPMMIAYNVPSEALHYIDTGAPRAVGDIMKLSTGETSGRKLSALCHHWALLEGRRFKKLQAWEVVEECESRLSEVGWARAHWGVKGFNSSVVVGTFAWAYPVNRVAVDLFFRKVSIGDGLRAGSPAQVLREWLITAPKTGGRRGRMEMALRILAAMHLEIKGTKKLTRHYLAIRGYEYFAKRKGLDEDRREWARALVSQHYGRER